MHPSSEPCGKGIARELSQALKKIVAASIVESFQPIFPNHLTTSRFMNQVYLGRLLRQL